MQNGIKSAKQSVLNAFPEMTFNSDKAIKTVKDIGAKISSAEQRLILGATALALQPAIDANNKRVDKETKKVSVARTIAKIIVGTTTGYFIRKGCIKGIQACSKPIQENLPKYKSMFMPKGKDLNINVNSDAFKQYQNAAGTIAALLVMTVTNFAIDAPMTKYLTNLFVDKVNEKEKNDLEKVSGGVA